MVAQLGQLPISNFMFTDVLAVLPPGLLAPL
jgi:hypothetical protein